MKTISVSAPVKPLKVAVKIEGSKSISNRLLILIHVLDNNFKIEHLSSSNDTKLLHDALKKIKEKRKAEINVGDAGTAMRFLTALLAVTEGEWKLTGSERMKQRPIGDLVEALTQIGAEIIFIEKENYPPLLINGKQLEEGKTNIKGNVSSQFISALLLISPRLKNGIEINRSSKLVSRPYLEMTISILEKFGVRISCKKNKIIVKPNIKNYSHKKFVVESDWSSASYWYSVCALNKKNTEIILTDFQKKSLQADSILPKLFSPLGVSTTFSGNKIILKNKKRGVKNFKYDFSDCPDIAQTLAVTCFGLGINSHLKGLGTLRIKETNRIFALKNELEKLGAKVNETKNSLKIFPPEKFSAKNILINTYNDHRMAMSFAPLALIYVNIKIENPEVVNKSYPKFWNDLKRAGFALNSQPYGFF